MAVSAVSPDTVKRSEIAEEKKLHFPTTFVVIESTVRERYVTRHIRSHFYILVLVSKNFSRCARTSHLGIAFLTRMPPVNRIVFLYATKVAANLSLKPRSSSTTSFSY